MSALTDFVKALISSEETTQSSTVEIPKIIDTTTGQTVMESVTLPNNQEERLTLAEWEERQKSQQTQQPQQATDYKQLYLEQVKANQKLANQTTIKEETHSLEEEVYSLMYGEYPKRGDFKL